MVAFLQSRHNGEKELKRTNIYVVHTGRYTAVGPGHSASDHCMLLSSMHLLIVYFRLLLFATHNSSVQCDQFPPPLENKQQHAALPFFNIYFFFVFWGCSVFSVFLLHAIPNPAAIKWCCLLRGRPTVSGIFSRIQICRRAPDIP